MVRMGGDLQAAKPIRLWAKGPFPRIPATIGTVVRTPTPNSAHPTAFRLCLLRRSEIRKPIPTPRATRVPAINPIFGIVRDRSFIRLSLAILLPCYPSPVVHLSGSPRFASIVATRLRPESIKALFRNDRNHHQGRNWIGPPPPQSSIQKQAAQQDCREVCTKIRLPRIGVHGRTLDPPSNP